MRERCTKSDQAREIVGSRDSILRTGTWAWKEVKIWELCRLRGHFVAQRASCEPVS